MLEVLRSSGPSACFLASLCGENDLSAATQAQAKLLNMHVGCSNSEQWSAVGLQPTEGEKANTFTAKKNTGPLELFQLPFWYCNWFTCFLTILPKIPACRYMTSCCSWWKLSRPEMTRWGPVSCSWELGKTKIILAKIDLCVSVGRPHIWLPHL